MQFKNKLFYHEAFVHLATENDILQCDCISVINGQKVEQMIFMGKSENSSEIEVRVYKANPTDAYILHKADKNLKRYESNDIFASFFFPNFLSASNFLQNLKINHPEYQVRPSKQ